MAGHPNHFSREARLATLRNMLRRLVDEAQATQPVDPVRATHLAEAIADLQTLIERVERAAEPDEAEEQPSSDPPPEADTEKARGIAAIPRNAIPRSLAAFSISIG
jgi:hypothetical protein